MASPYFGTDGVLHNKLGITDAAELKAAEYGMTLARTEEIRDKRIDLGVQGFGLARQQAIHHHLFQDVYGWAGKVRTVLSSKRMENGLVSVFAEPESIEQRWQALEVKTDAFVRAKGLSFQEKCNALADIFIEANAIHPFPEGNGRSMQVFMEQLAREQGIELDYSKVDAKEWNRASALSGTHGKLFERVHLIPSRPDPEPIKKIFSEIASPARELGHAQSLQAIEDTVKQLQSKPLPGGLRAVVEHAKQDAGKPYQGKIIALTEHHALQQIGANKFIIHERKQSLAQDLAVGRCATIAYGQDRQTSPQPLAKGKERER